MVFCISVSQPSTARSVVVSCWRNDVLNRFAGVKGLFAPPRDYCRLELVLTRRDHGSCGYLSAAEDHVSQPSRMSHHRRTTNAAPFLAQVVEQDQPLISFHSLRSLNFHSPMVGAQHRSLLVLQKYPPEKTTMIRLGTRIVSKTKLQATLGTQDVYGSTACSSELGSRYCRER